MLLADIGAVPCIAIKSNVKSKSYGYPAWNRMVNMYRENPDDYTKHYNRRSIIKGVFSAMKRRMQSSIRSRIFHNQVFRSCMQAAVWNAISLAYNNDMNERQRWLLANAMVVAHKKANKMCSIATD